MPACLCVSLSFCVSVLKFQPHHCIVSGLLSWRASALNLPCVTPQTPSGLGIICYQAGGPARFRETPRGKLCNTVQHCFHTIQYCFVREKESNAPLPEGPSVRSVRRGSLDILGAAYTNPSLPIHFHLELIHHLVKSGTLCLLKVWLYNIYKRPPPSLRGHQFYLKKGSWDIWRAGNHLQQPFPHPLSTFTRIRCLLL